MQAKITAFFNSSASKTPHAPQLFDPTEGAAQPWETTEPEIRITYKRRTPPADFSRNNENSSETELRPLSSSVPLDASINPVSTSNRNLNKKRSYAQFHLELGQSDFLLHTCSTCGLKYARGEEGDEKVHKEFHKNYTNGVKFKAWRRERVVSTHFSDGARIILVLDGDPPAQMSKVQEVVKIMEGELGLSEGWLLHKLCKVYMFISAHRIAGCLVAEPINTAYHVVSNYATNRSSNNINVKKDKSNSTILRFGNFSFQQEVIKSRPSVSRSDAFEKDHDRAIFYEEEPVPALCGIRAIWVAPSNRRSHVATKLLDAARKSFYKDHVVEPSQMAFSQPTSAGQALASSYCGTESFLVYNTGVNRKRAYHFCA